MSKTILFRHATLVLITELMPDGAVLCREGRIIRVGPDRELCKEAADQVVDLNGQWLAPGFIDLHIHGMHRHLIDHGPAALQAICDILPQTGVTGFLAGICPRPKGEDARFVASLASVRSSGSRILGFHMEGPFLTLTGALPKEALGAADPERVENLVSASQPYPTVFSIAPDFEGIIDLLPRMQSTGMPAFITHTRATVDQTLAAIDAGARHATHFYDVFPPPPETDPGVRPCGTVETILADPRASVDFILDGEHVNPMAIRMALACKGPDRVCLITDANIGAGLPPGKHDFLGGVEVSFTYPGGPARLTGKTHQAGTLAGSGLTLDLAMRNAIRLLDIDLPMAVRMVSANPAQVLGLDHLYGRIAEGLASDFTVLDQNRQVCQTWIAGRQVFTRSN
ncbi:MAG: hypothetical protein A2498_11865 [Lentisphaerae bacterium RIFOXYC12_FULL_60_16]|nr:MAG: hypothetical protein A2498_11865 [Lentisphaerae bacterium RIFOXYC12_FULL_60_16]OGV72583.1 MAG: hypothetical protein A2269_01140 [Lentisphaerae bacterium RIFOXYA12_FULL_60_10]OGV77295.1 MAG: hypothetical protein A2340_06210 [Lentisphaerae bacterium RIFOXYB12_FULL_60_10]